MSDQDLAFASLSRLHKGLLNKEFSSKELTSLFLSRIKKFNPSLHSWIIYNEASALEQAEEADAKIAKGDTASPLLGIPMGISDALQVKGFPTSRGAIKLREHIVDKEYNEVTSFRNAGAVFLGKTNVSEFYLSPYMENSLLPPCENPWGKGLSPAGQEGGAASAISSGQCPIALGASSMRLASAFTGLTSIKATRDLIPLIRDYPVSAIAHATYATGPCAHNVRDLAQMLQILCQHSKKTLPDYVSSIEKNPKKLRIGYCKNMNFAPVSKEVVDCVEEALKKMEEMGHEVDPVCLAIDENVLLHYNNLWAVNNYIPVVGCCGADNEACGKMTKDTLEWLNLGKKTSGIAYCLALAYMKDLEAKTTQLYEHYDIVVSPASSVARYEIEHPPMKGLNRLTGLSAFVLPASFAGVPVISMPCGFTKEGLPVGMQLTANHYNEELLFQLARCYEDAFKYNQRRPQGY